ncbi:MAG: BREX-2 system adenine-specific DNA-methyltransferase PglX [Sandaracinaceae bacterium]|nr:MAG: BREX-2 system adenine-specific DNA-methyltransferase PglX [Sandaracinaceae bacterium]
MDDSKRKALTDGLSALSVRFAAEMRDQMRGVRAADHAVRARAAELHADEKVGEDFEVWTDLLSRRAAVMWVLKSVYVRVLEDRGLLSPRRIVDATSPQLFGKLAPDLGDTAYLRWVYRDLAQPDGGLPELFALQPAEIATPGDALSRELLDFWRQRDPDTGELVYRFDDERFDGRLMGDLYQDLDPVVKDRFALLQTPDFILEFILDETLTPAIEEFGVDEVRLLDPACGSGHFLLEAFRRLVAAMREAHPERSAAAVVPDVLSRVVGVDLNDYACGLARARLIMTALETLGSGDLTDASALRPQVFWADGLEQVERDALSQESLAFDIDGAAPRSSLTPLETRLALRPVLKPGFHVVVGNPPYIRESDERRKEYSREKIGKKQRYTSAYGEYSLGAPFVERMHQLSVRDGFYAAITANSFAKRKFGKAFVEKFLPTTDLQVAIDLQDVSLEGHGTPTLILIGRRRPPSGASVLFVGTKRGGAGAIDGAVSELWKSIVTCTRTPGVEDESSFSEVVERGSTTTHPWTLSSGEESRVLRSLTSASRACVDDIAKQVGFGCITKDDEAFSVGDALHARHNTTSRRFITGKALRNWGYRPSARAIFPYNARGETLAWPQLRESHTQLWRYRSQLREGKGPGFKTKRDAGRLFYEYGMFYPDRLFPDPKLAYAYVATHTHCSLVEGGAVFNQGAPLIVMSPTADVTVYEVLAVLNSSVGCFFARQISHQVAAPEPWLSRCHFDAGRIKQVPIPSQLGQVGEFGRRLSELAAQRDRDSCLAFVTKHAQEGASALRGALDRRHESDLARLRQLVGLQDELDWHCYQAFGLADVGELGCPPAVEAMTPGCRPFEQLLAPEDPWFEKHGWVRPTQPGEMESEICALVSTRVALIADSPALALLEQPSYKRRWFRPDYTKEEREAMAHWLAERIEEQAETRTEPFTVRSIAAALQQDPAIEAVAMLFAGAGFDLDRVVAQILDEESVPNLKSHVFKKKGLVKRAAWERTWELQHAEDAWDAKKKAHDDAIATGVDPHEAPPLPEGKRPEPDVPPKYGSGDFLKPTYWKHRGKLDVPKERFIAYTEVPPELTEQGQAPLYGWAGWDHLGRAQVLLALDEQAEELGVELKDRYGLLWGAQFLLPYVRWGDDTAQSAAKEFAAILRDLVGDSGVTDEMLAEWTEAHPPPKGSRKPRKKKAAKKRRSSRKSHKGETPP